eukprot:TRINITY_DN8108_c0_g1_i1.p1 TRINITY_DN8108_c0_g1~~TRINITY_DN8108_c0_g1_i1.p1  ORF type:complete len:239 (+),score=46.52 TRINITY_DN8108_c0_g1_i1:107-823(+)
MGVSIFSEPTTANPIASQETSKDQEITSTILEALRRNESLGGPGSEKGIRIVVTGGTSSSNLLPEGVPTLIVLVATLHPPSPDLYAQGAKLITYPTTRTYPTAKTTNYIVAINAQQRAHSQGALDALYVSPQGDVLEGTTWNIFAFFGGTLVTPREDVLKGLTRETVLSVASRVFNVQEGPLSLSRLLQADEVFICSSSKRILPVSHIDGKPIGKGVPGINTKKISILFDEDCTKSTL